MFLLVPSRYVDTVSNKVELFSWVKPHDKGKDLSYRQLVNYGSIENEDGKFFVKMYQGYLRVDGGTETGSITEFTSKAPCFVGKTETFIDAVDTLCDFFELPHLDSKRTYISIVDSYTVVISEVFTKVSNEFAFFIKAPKGTPLSSVDDFLLLR